MKKQTVLMHSIYSGYLGSTKISTRECITSQLILDRRYSTVLLTQESSTTTPIKLRSCSKAIAIKYLQLLVLKTRDGL